MILKSWMSNTEWPCEVCTATLSDANKLVNNGGNKIHATFLGELKRAFNDLTEVGSGLVGTTSWKTGLASDASWDEHCKHAEEKLLKGDDVKGGLSVSGAIGKLKTITAEGTHLQDTFRLDIRDDMKPSGDLLVDAEKWQWEAKLVLGVNTLSGNVSKLRKFGLMMRDDFSTVSASTGDESLRGFHERFRWR